MRTKLLLTDVMYSPCVIACLYNYFTHSTSLYYKRFYHYGNFNCVVGKITSV